MARIKKNDMSMNGRSVQIRFGGPLTPAVKWIMITCGVVFILQQIVGIMAGRVMEYYLGLSYNGVVHELKLWQPVTYMFLHSRDNWFHIIFNMIGLWMFAGELEELWGTKLFLKYFFVTGIGAGIFILLIDSYMYAHYGQSGITIGVSGAIYAILLAYGVTWPNRIVLLFFVIPIKIKYLVMLFGGIEFIEMLKGVFNANGNISHIGHIGGLVTGALYFFMRIRQGKMIALNSVKMKNPLSDAVKKARIKKKKIEIDQRIKAKEIIDTLLEKIAREGMSSLTPEERKLLEWARKHYYPENKETIH